MGLRARREKGRESTEAEGAIYHNLRITYIYERRRKKKAYHLISGSHPVIIFHSIIAFHSIIVCHSILAST